MATPNQSVCSNHFGQDCYNFSLNRKILKPFAVPSLSFESIPELDLSMISPISSTSRTMHNSFESIPELDLSMISPIPSTSRTMHKHSLSPNDYLYSTPKKKNKRRFIPSAFSKYVS
ncbi:uncharacterized protein LOC112681598 [Sipha flava]|uniref:Uncharacterized protein LOC112681598 n=1 Tax=Sipha flava TaxID=143950 RepID=A0A8B8FA03_9HEMI|nr:uncharacterized protein LOC112681598 [Sipha flava]XP_025407629.1 uncharacterized protein LOC112681598 [Sipha flava]